MIEVGSLGNSTKQRVGRGTGGSLQFFLQLIYMSITSCEEKMNAPFPEGIAPKFA